MLIYLLFLIGGGVVAGFYAHQNSGTQDVSLFGWQWSGVDLWVPVVAAAAAIALVGLVAMLFASWRVATLQQRTAQLRAEIAGLRQGAAGVATMPAAERELVGRDAGSTGWWRRRRRTVLVPADADAGDRVTAP